MEIPNYKYHHHPNTGKPNDEEKGKPKHNFIGRDMLQNRFLDILLKGGRNGAYLVTGYRGMGKTSLVNIVVEKYRKKEEIINPSVKVVSLKISLAQSKLDESDVLRHIVKLLYEQIRKDRVKNYFPFLEYYSYFLSIIILVITGLLIFSSTEGFSSEGFFNFKDSLLNDKIGIGIITSIVTISAFILIFLHNTIKIIFESIISLINNKINLHKDLIINSKESIDKILRIGNWIILISLLYVIQSIFKFFDSSYIFLQFKFADLTFIVALTLIIISLVLKIRSYRNISNPPGGTPYIIIQAFNHLQNFLKLYSLNKQITLLYDRSSATITKTSGDSSFLKDVINTLTGSQVRTYPIASAKEIEYELIDILDKYDFKKFIFIFDELDKVEMDIEHQLFDNSSHHELERTYLNDLRERKQVIIRVFSSMKHLLTEAKARFIFIAGREMFDASLADISDRQSALGSIFHSVFYVESFLKGIKDTNPSSESSNLNQIEAYLETILFDREGGQKSLYKSLWELLMKNKPDQEESEAIKIMFCMHNYVTYLAYRSNGSPKKLIRLIEENMLNGESIGIRQELVSNDKLYFSDDRKSVIFSDQKPINPQSERVFINFSYKQQYKFGFNAYLFLPFLFTKKSYLNNFSDSINVSTPYLMDNIIKFHPFAFSNHNLELLPELLSSNKAPELRNFIQNLIDYLGKNHIREIDSGLFKYKFLDRIHHEIAFISRVSDEESAAFNFSLDENHSIKTHLAHKIKFIRKTFRNFKKFRVASVESLTFLNDLLGDSHLFDEAYKDSIVSLVDSIHDIPHPVEKTSIESFLLWMRIKLKISMIFDKMKYYEMAVGNLGVAMERSILYLSGIKGSDVDINGKLPLYRELLQVTQLAILGSIYVQEKFGESITYSKLETYLNQYEKIHQHDTFEGYTGRDMMMASFFANLGILLYYKNKTLPYRTSVAVKEIMLQLKNNRTGNTITFSEKRRIIDLFNTIIKTPVFRLGIGGNTELNFSKFIKPSFFELNSVFDYQSIDFRFSLITYISYKKALGAYLAINTQKVNKEELKLPYLIEEALKLLRGYRNVHDTRKLSLLADSISRLGDLLYTLFNNDKFINKDTGTNKQILEKTIQKYKESKAQKTTAPNDVEYENIVDKAIFESLRNDNDLTYINYPIYLYYLAGKLYIKASKNTSASFQFKKILLTIHRSGALYSITNEHFKLLIIFLKETILNKILKLSSSSSIVSDRLQISSMKHYMDNKEISLEKDKKSYFYNHLATSADAREGLVLMAGIQIRQYKNLSYADNSEKFTDFATACKELPEFNLLRQTNSISLQSLRVMELALQVKLNTFLLYNTLNKNLIQEIKNSDNKSTKISLVPLHKGKNRNKNKEPKSVSWQENLFPYAIYKHADTEQFHKGKRVSLQSNGSFYIPYIQKLSEMSNETEKEAFRNYTKLITNSIFCLHQGILTANITGINYMQGNAYLGAFHMKLGNWVKHLNLCRSIKLHISKVKKTNSTQPDPSILTFINDMENDLKTLVGETSLRNIDDSMSQYQIALEYFENSIQLHSEGPAYKHHLNTMIYLEDDYGDTYNHFGASLERQSINSGKIRKIINQLKTQLSYSSLFRYENFVSNSK